MATADYCIQPGTTLTDDATDPLRARALSLGCSAVCVGDPTGLITVWPSVAVTGSASAPVIIPDNTQSATSAVVATALSAASTAEAAAASSISQANANLATLVNGMQAQIAQAKIDLTTLAASSDPLAPILARNIEGSLAIAQGLADTLVALKLIVASEVPATGV